jgi:hypothetical protein
MILPTGIRKVRDSLPQASCYGHSQAQTQQICDHTASPGVAGLFVYVATLRKQCWAKQDKAKHDHHTAEAMLGKAVGSLQGQI